MCWACTGALEGETARAGEREEVEEKEEEERRDNEFENMTSSANSVFKRLF